MYCANCRSGTSKVYREGGALTRDPSPPRRDAPNCAYCPWEFFWQLCIFPVKLLRQLCVLSVTVFSDNCAYCPWVFSDNCANLKGTFCYGNLLNWFLWILCYQLTMQRSGGKFTRWPNIIVRCLLFNFCGLIREPRLNPSKACGEPSGKICIEWLWLVCLVSFRWREVEVGWIPHCYSTAGCPYHSTALHNKPALQSTAQHCTLLHNTA